MSYFLFIIKSAFEDFRRSKLQTFLTSLGILIGVFAVVTLTAMGLGLKKYISNQFDALGKNTLFVAPGKLLQSGGFGASSLLGSRFDLKDYNRLKRVRSITAITPLSSKSGTAKGTKKSEFVTIFFSSEAFFDISGFEIDKGRFLDKRDIDKRAKVLVAGPNYDSYFFGPYTTGFIFDPDKKFIRFAMKTDENINISTVKDEVKKEMLKRYNDDEFSIVEPTEILSVVN